MNSIIEIQIGQYIYTIYLTALIPIIICILAAVSFIFFLFKRRKKKSLRAAYGISKWQKAELPLTLDYVCNEIDNEEAQLYYKNNEEIAEGFKEYVQKNKIWDYGQILSLSENAPFIISKILFYDAQSSLTEYDDGADRSLLLFHAIDLINGGPIFEKKNCIWMMEDIEEYPDSGIDATINRMKAVYQQAIINIHDQMPEEEGAIPEYFNCPSYIKEYTEEDLVAAAADLTETPGIGHISQETRDIIVHGLLFTLNDYFQFEGENVSELYICYIRCLMCAISAKMYDELFPMLKNYKF